MKRYCIILFICASLFGATTQVTQPVLGPDGLPASGRVSIQISSACKSGANYVGIKPINVSISAGAFTVSLVPNDSCLPSGTSYAVTWQLSGGNSWTETWLVPTSTLPVTVDSVVVHTVPPLSYEIQWGQLAQDGALVGQAPIWNGSSWVPGPAGSAQVNADWAAVSGLSQILNKPTIPPALGYTAENTANKGAASGYAGLDANALVPAANLPGPTYLAPFTGAVSQTQSTKNAQTISVIDAGAVRDERTVLDGAMTAGSNLVNSATANFTSADIGKVISVAGAGTSANQIEGAITAVNSATQAVMSINASFTVTGQITWIGTDNQPAVWRACDYIKSLGGGRVYFPAGRYLFLYKTPNPGQTFCDEASNVEIYGDGQASSVIFGLGTNGNLNYALNLAYGRNIINLYCTSPPSTGCSAPSYGLATYYLINTQPQTGQTVTLTTAAQAANFTPGSYVFIESGNGAPGTGNAPEHWEWNQVQSVNATTGAVTLQNQLTDAFDNTNAAYPAIMAQINLATHDVLVHSMGFHSMAAGITVTTGGTLYATLDHCEFTSESPALGTSYLWNSSSWHTTIQNSKFNGIASDLGDAAAYWTFKNNVVLNSRSVIAGSGTFRRYLIDGNYFQETQQSPAITLAGSISGITGTPGNHEVQISNNYIEMNSTNIYAGGIAISGTTNSIIRDNVLFGPLTASMSLNSNGILIGSYSTNTVVKHNVLVSPNLYYGINLSAGGALPTSITGTSIQDNTFSGTSVAVGIPASGVTNTTIGCNDLGTAVIADAGSGSVYTCQTTAITAIPNSASTGTTQFTLTKYTGAPATAVIAATTDTGGIIGITVSGAGTTGNPTIQTSGNAYCVFSNATTAQHYVTISTATGGDCMDTGAATYPTAGQVIGKVLSTNASAGTFPIQLFPPDTRALGAYTPQGSGAKLLSTGTVSATPGSTYCTGDAAGTATTSGCTNTVGALVMAQQSLPVVDCLCALGGDPSFLANKAVQLAYVPTGAPKGSGFVTADTVTTTNGGCTTPAVFSVTASAGAITALTQATMGLGCTSVPTTFSTSGSGTGAVIAFSTCNNTIDDTTTITAFNSAYSIPGGSLVAGNSFAINAELSLWTGPAAQGFLVSPSLYYGVFQLTSSASTLANNIAAANFEMRYNATFAAVGASGSVRANYALNGIPGTAVTSFNSFGAQTLTTMGTTPLSIQMRYFKNGTVSGTYTSGPGVTGSAGQTCLLTAFNGAAGSGAAATVYLTSTNTIASGTPIYITNTGSAYTAVSTSATQASGTATCTGGAATIVTVLGGAQGNAVNLNAFKVIQEH